MYSALNMHVACDGGADKDVVDDENDLADGDMQDDDLDEDGDGPAQKKST